MIDYKITPFYFRNINRVPACIVNQEQNTVGSIFQNSIFLSFDNAFSPNNQWV